MSRKPLLLPERLNLLVLAFDSSSVISIEDRAIVVFIWCLTLELAAVGSYHEPDWCYSVSPASASDVVGKMFLPIILEQPEVGSVRRFGVTIRIRGTA